MIDKKVLTGIFAAIGASLCCITPVLAVLAGSTGMASNFSWMEPFRPYLIALTVLVLAYAWWDKLKPVKQDMECACDPDEEGNVSFWYTKTFLAIVTVFAVVMLSFPYWGDALIGGQKEQVVIVNRTNILKKTINIEGMTCVACEATVAKVGGDVHGVINISASTADKHAVVEYDKTKTDIDAIMTAIGTTGYKPVSYDDETGNHKTEGIEVKAHNSELKSLKTDTASKCGGGKCGVGKCGAGKCGSSK